MLNNPVDHQCRFCERELWFLKRLSNAEFCGDSHRLAYERKQNELAIDRLYAHQPASPINPKLDLALDLKLTRKDPSSGPTADDGATAAA